MVAGGWESRTGVTIIIKTLKSPPTPQNACFYVFIWLFAGHAEGQKTELVGKGVCLSVALLCLEVLPTAPVCVGMGWAGHSAGCSPGFVSAPLWHGETLLLAEVEVVAVMSTQGHSGLHFFHRGEALQLTLLTETSCMILGNRFISLTSSF